jgi:hypothetical protein
MKTITDITFERNRSYEASIKRLNAHLVRAERRIADLEAELARMMPQVRAPARPSEDDLLRRLEERAVKLDYYGEITAARYMRLAAEEIAHLREELAKRR